MTDDTSFPTAIVPSRPGALRERWDTLARRIGDPLTTLFVEAATNPDSKQRIQAASELLPYRYPRLKMSEVNHTGGGGPAVNIQINITPPNQEKVIHPSSVIPSVDPLD